MVSAALVAQQKVDEEAAATTVLSGDETEPVGEGLGTDQGKLEQVSKGSPETATKKKVVQQPLYFVSSLLQGARSRYYGVQKLIFSLVTTSRKLSHYFQAHEIKVVTRFPL